MNKLFISILLLLTTLITNAQEITNKIVIDQFGYRPEAKKIAVIRDPQIGFDASESYTPSNNFALVDVETKQSVFTGTPTVWNGGTTDVSSGDKAWWFDFSSVQIEGTYYVLDIDNNKKSFEFVIKNNVYQDLLKQAVRTFFYQRSGYKKEAQFAGANWADEASHVGPLQDLNCRYYDDKNNASIERDVHGGWYDAGDFNKYTNWTANYVVELLRAYSERPEVWTDDYNIPESGNGIPDILDEVKWGLDHLLRLQNEDGSVIAIVAADGASPPSTAKGQSLYGAVNTSATLSSSGAFAFASKIYRTFDKKYADTLLVRAEKAWNWAQVNPNVIWKNNDEASGTKGIGAGNQEVNDAGRLTYKLRASCFLFEMTNDINYKTYFESKYQETGLIKNYFAHSFSDEEQDILLYYSQLSQASVSVISTIRNRYLSAMNNGQENFPAVDNQKDPYLNHLKTYTWGSSKQKCATGLMFYALPMYDIGSTRNDEALEIAEHYIHYIHGVNPKNLVYISNMYKYGGDHCVNQFYHTWFYEGTDWDEYGKSKYGPAPGFVVGGANPKYKKATCCPNGCGSTTNNAKCNAIDMSTLLNQPNQKSYLDFNNSWPLNSWEVTENSGGYQCEYIRLLSKFVTLRDKVVTSKNISTKSSLSAYPNPTTGKLYIQGLNGEIWTLYNTVGQVLLQGKNSEIDISHFNQGIYLLSTNHSVIEVIKK